MGGQENYEENYRFAVGRNNTSLVHPCGLVLVYLQLAQTRL
jgi:hypothetical protein